jgi:hypothetical protein
MAEYEVNGVTYEFPDTYTPEQVKGILTAQGIIRAPAPAAPLVTTGPLLRVRPSFPEFQPVPDIERRISEAVTKEVEERTQAVAENPLATEYLTDVAAETRRQAEEAARKARERVVMPGVSRPVEPGEGLFTRPSRIQEVPTVMVKAEAPLLEAERPAALGEFPTPLQRPDQVPELRRMYLDPATGQYREPTAEEEFSEAFQLQTELSEARMREESRERQRREREVVEAIERGEPLPIYDTYIAPTINGIFTEERQGAGVVETPLAAALRSTLGLVSVAAAEGYFRGLGYEVDSKGMPVDPEDLGVAIADFRKSLGLPDVVQPLEGVRAVTMKGAELLDAGPETATTLDNFFRAMGAVAMPLPGVATQRQTRKVTTFDPEGRRRVTDVEAPDPVEDFGAFIEFEKRRVAENLAKGRSWGDEFLDTPAMTAFAKQVYDDPDAAFYLGLIPEVAIPAGPELLGGPVGYGLGAIGDALRLTNKAKALSTARKAASTLTAARQSEAVAQGALDLAESTRGVRTPQKQAQLIARQQSRLAAAQDARKAAEQRAVQALSQQATNTSPAVVKAVAKKAIERGLPVPENDPALAQRVRAKRAELLRLIDEKVEVPTDVNRVVQEANLSAWYRDPAGGQALLPITPGRAREIAKEALRKSVPEPEPVPDGLPYLSDLFEDNYGRTIDYTAKSILDTAAQHAASQFARDTVLYTPGDFVALSDTLFVPRFMERSAKAELNNHRKSLFLKTSSEVSADLLKQADEVERAGQPALSTKMRVLANRVQEEAVEKAKAVQKAGAEARARAVIGESPFTDLLPTGDKARPFAFVREAKPSVQLFGLTDLSKPLRKEIETSLLAAASAKGLKGQDARVFVRQFDQAKPGSRFGYANKRGEAMRNELAKYDTWDEVPASLRREALGLYDNVFRTELGPMARKAADITALQARFDSGEQAMGAFAMFNDPRKYPRFAAYLRNRAAIKGTGAERSSLAASRAAREISIKGQTVYRTLRNRVAEAVAQTKSVDEALDLVLRQELVGPPESAWDAVFESLYGPKGEGAKRRALVFDPELVNQTPTVKRIKEVDAALTSQGIVPPPGGAQGVTERIPLVGKSLSKLMFGDRNYHAVMLKVIVEQGLKRSLSQETQQIFAIENIAQLPPQFERLFRSAEEVPEDLVRAFATTTQPEKAVPLFVPDYTTQPNGIRISVVDTSAGDLEQKLTSGLADGLFSVKETVPVEAREAVRKWSDTFIDLADYAATANRNLQTRLNYGYIIPNVPLISSRLAAQALIPLATIGATDALRAAGRMTVRNLTYARDAVLRRRSLGTGITDVNGVYYSPRTLEGLADSYNLGLSQSEAERVGALSRDLLNSASAQASSLNVGGAREAVSVLNPLDRGLFLRFSEALELNFRRSVFETAIAGGLPPADAADLARRSMFDYDDTPAIIRDYASKVFAQSSYLYKLGVQGLTNVVENPQNAVRLLKAVRNKAEAQDPYNVYGDKAIKSLGLVEVGGDEYFLPEIPGLSFLDNGLAAARRADLIIEDFKKALSDEDAVNEGYKALTNAGGNALEVVGGLISPDALEAFERYSEGDAYVTTGVPNAEPLSDEKVFYALMLQAHVQDPERLPGGEWEKFLRLYKPKVVAPPEGLAAKSNPRFWSRQPPDGVPHLLMGIVDGEELFMAFEPSKPGLARIKAVRSITPATLEKLQVLYSAFLNEEFVEAKTTAKAPPLRIYTEPVMAETAAGAAAEMLFPPAATPEQLRRGQVEGVRAIREGVRVE